MEVNQILIIWEIAITIIIPLMAIVGFNFRQTIRDNKQSIEVLYTKVDTLKDEVHKEYVHGESLNRLEQAISAQITKLDKNVNKNFDMLHAMIKGHDENIKHLMRSKC